MRILDHNNPFVLAHQPFAGSGTALYVGSGNPDPGPTAIKYRNFRIVNGTDALLLIGSTFNIGGANVTKTAAVDIVKDPLKQFSYVLPAGLANKTIYLQVRRHASHVENPTIYRPLRIELDGSLAADASINGSGRLLRVEKRDGGGVRFFFVFSPTVGGVQPTQFVLTRISGPTAVGDVSLALNARRRQHTIDVAGLQDGGVYVFQIKATDGVTEKLLIGNAGGGSANINVTADASGPSQPATASLEAY